MYSTQGATKLSSDFVEPLILYYTSFSKKSKNKINPAVIVFLIYLIFSVAARAGYSTKSIPRHWLLFVADHCVFINSSPLALLRCWLRLRLWLRTLALLGLSFPLWSGLRLRALPLLLRRFRSLNEV